MFSLNKKKSRKTMSSTDLFQAGEEYKHEDQLGSSSRAWPSHPEIAADHRRQGQKSHPALPKPTFLEGSRSVSDLRAANQQIHHPPLPDPANSRARHLRSSRSSFFQGFSDLSPEERLREQKYKSRSLSVAPDKPRIGAPLNSRRGAFDYQYPPAVKQLAEPSRLASAENARNAPPVLPQQDSEVQTAVAQPLKTQKAKQVDIPRRKVIPQPSPPPPPHPSRPPPPPPPPQQHAQHIKFDIPEQPKSALQEQTAQSSSSLFHRNNHQKRAVTRSASLFSFTNMFKFGSNKNKTSSGKSKTSWFSHSTPHQSSETENKTGSPSLPSTSASPEAAEALSPSQYNSLVGKRQLQEAREVQNKIDESRKLRDVFYGIKERDENQTRKKGRTGPDDISYGSPKQFSRRTLTAQNPIKDNETHNDEDADDSDGLCTSAEDKAFLGASGMAAAESGHPKTISPLVDPAYKFGSDVPVTSSRKGKERVTTYPAAKKSATNPLAEEMARMRVVPAEQYNAAIGYDETKSGLQHHPNVMDFVERPDRAKKAVAGDRFGLKDAKKLPKDHRPDRASKLAHSSIPQTVKSKETGSSKSREGMTYDEFGGNPHVLNEASPKYATTLAASNIGSGQREGPGNTSAQPSSSGSSSTNVQPRPRVAPIYVPDDEGPTMDPRRRSMPPPAKRLMTPACNFSAQWPHPNRLGTLYEGRQETTTQQTQAPYDEATPSSSVYGPDADQAFEAEDEDEGVGRAV